MLLLLSLAFVGVLLFGCEPRSGEIVIVSGGMLFVVAPLSFFVVLVCLFVLSPCCSALVKVVYSRLKCAQTVLRE